MEDALLATTIHPDRTVADVVSAHPATARVFAARRIDFCCKGRTPIGAAARARGLDPDALCAELTRAAASGEGDPEPARLPTGALLDHIVATHHALLREALPWLETLAAKVAGVHGDHDPRLVELEAALRDLSALLLAHLDEEEQALFPALRAGGAGVGPQLAAMREEHDQVAAGLERLRRLTDDLTPPGWACRSYRTLLAELARVEADIHRHVHLENHALAPRFAPGA